MEPWTAAARSVYNECFAVAGSLSPPCVNYVLGMASRALCAVHFSTKSISTEAVLILFPFCTTLAVKLLAMEILAPARR